MRVPDQAEEFLRAHSTTASVPTPPLALVHESAAALASTLDSPSCAPAAAQPQPALPQQQPGDSQSGTSHMPGRALLPRAPSKRLVTCIVAQQVTLSSPAWATLQHGRGIAC